MPFVPPLGLIGDGLVLKVACAAGGGCLSPTASPYLYKHTQVSFEHQTFTERGICINFRCRGITQMLGVKVCQLLASHERCKKEQNK